MFTGLVEEMGHVVRLDTPNLNLTIAAQVVLQGTQLGDSIAVNGVCLTVTQLSEATFSVGLSPETLRRSNLGSLRAHDRVNLERAVTPTTRLGGHYVQGHVDGVGIINSMVRERNALVFSVNAAPELMRYIVEKGFVCIDGTSLTVTEVDRDHFGFMLVSYTQDKITLSTKKPGNKVNIETDILGKYVEKLLGLNTPQSNLNADFLQQHGFG